MEIRFMTKICPECSKPKIPNSKCTHSIFTNNLRKHKARDRCSKQHVRKYWKVSKKQLLRGQYIGKNGFRYIKNAYNLVRKYAKSK